MATITVTLTETDICDAIALWVKERGMTSVGRAFLNIQKGDRPGEAATIQATVSADMIKPAPQR